MNDKNRSLLLNKGKIWRRRKQWPWWGIFMPQALARCRYLLVDNINQKEVPVSGPAGLTRLVPMSLESLSMIWQFKHKATCSSVL